MPKNARIGNIMCYDFVHESDSVGSQLTSLNFSSKDPGTEK